MNRCISLLNGGLGNQLFQYAFARALTVRSGASLALDAVTLFDRDFAYSRSYALEIFKLPTEIQVITSRRRCERLFRHVITALEKGRPLSRRRYVIEERPIKFRREYLEWELSRDASLIGYWQCSQYFDSIDATLRSDLSLRGSKSEAGHVNADKLTEEDSVAIHVRRCQYSRLLTVEYYREAVRLMRASLRNPKFYVFSDSPGWWSQYCRFADDATLIEGDDSTSSEDFCLMVKCRHFIIANSSYSWWAAWLANAMAKSVIAPGDTWWDNPDTVPSGWLPVYM